MLSVVLSVFCRWFSVSLHFSVAFSLYYLLGWVSWRLCLLFFAFRGFSSRVFEYLYCRSSFAFLLIHLWCIHAARWFGIHSFVGLLFQGAFVETKCF